jgi:rRNA maturation endonuclease Nob1
VCPNCAFISDEPLECCPRCGARVSVERDENVADKASADSFPASDPPQH